MRFSKEYGKLEAKEVNFRNRPQITTQKVMVETVNYSPPAPYLFFHFSIVTEILAETMYTILVPYYCSNKLP